MDRIHAGPKTWEHDAYELATWILLILILAIAAAAFYTLAQTGEADFTGVSVAVAAR